MKTLKTLVCLSCAVGFMLGLLGTPVALGAAYEELQEHNFSWNAESFVNIAGMGNLEIVTLFVRAGMGVV